jgi:hypothetical protein
MAKFDSPLGVKPIQGQSQREFVIPDESGFSGPPPQIRPPRETSAPVFDQQAMQEFNARMAATTIQAAPQSVPSEIEMQFAEAKRLKREGKERLSEGARRRIEILVGMTRLTRDFEIDGKLYKLKTLTSKELEEAMSASSEFDGTVRFIFEARKQVLARSLVVVAGLDLSQFLSSTNIEDRIYFLDEMDHELLVRIYSEYNIMAQELQDKYAIKTEADVKEVLEDLKK